MGARTVERKLISLPYISPKLYKYIVAYVATTLVCKGERSPGVDEDMT